MHDHERDAAKIGAMLHGMERLAEMADKMASYNVDLLLTDPDCSLAAWEVWSELRRTTAHLKSATRIGTGNYRDMENKEPVVTNIRFLHKTV